MIEITVAGILSAIIGTHEALGAARPIAQRLADEWTDRPPQNHHLAKGAWSAAVRGFHSCMNELYLQSAQVPDPDAFNEFAAADHSLRRKDKCLLTKPQITEDLGRELERNLTGALLNLGANRDEHAEAIESARAAATNRMWSVFCQRFRAGLKRPETWNPPDEVRKAFYGEFPGVQSWFHHFCLRIGEELKENLQFRSIFEGLRLVEIGDRLRRSELAWKQYSERFERAAQEDRADHATTHRLLRELRKPEVVSRVTRFQGRVGTARFKELEFYDKSERSVFFGRSELCTSAQGIFEESWAAPSVPLLLIFGESGAGKSSVLRAGILAALDERERQDFEYRTVVVTANELSVNAGGFRESPLGVVVESALDALGRSARVKKSLADIASSYDKPKSAVGHILAALDELPISTDQARMVIGLDQFEELLDRNIAADAAGLYDPLFRFLRLACESRRVGVVMTCQSNRRQLLSEDRSLSPVFGSGTSIEVRFPVEAEVKSIVRRTFLSAGVDVSREIVDELYRRLSLLSGVNRDSLLPLVSLSMSQLYGHCLSLAAKLNPSRTAAWIGNMAASSGPLPETDDGSPYQLAGVQFSSRIRDDGILALELGDVPERLLDISTAIADQAELALSEVSSLPGWSEEAIPTQLRRLVRIQSFDDDRLDLPSIDVPLRGVGRLLVERLRQHRLLRVTERDRVQIVHEAVVRHWPGAQRWLKEEIDKLRGLKAMAADAERWTENGGVVEPSQVEDDRIDTYASLLKGMWNIFHPVDGTTASDRDARSREFAFAVVTRPMRPSRMARDEQGEFSHFLLAVLYGRCDLVKAYLRLEPGAAREHRSSLGANAAYLAAFSQSAEMVRLVLEHGADPGVVTANGYRAVHVAAAQGQLEILKLLVSKDASAATPAPAGETLLHSAARCDDIEMADWLLTSRLVSPDSPADDGWTPLHIASWFGSAGFVSLLLGQGGINASLLTADGWSPLLLACERGKPEIVRELLNHHADPSAKAKDGRTALHLAVGSGSHATVSELLGNDAVDRSAITPSGMSVVELAIDAGDLDVLSAVLDDDAIDPDLSGSSRARPLVAACRSGKKDVVAALVAAGAEVNRLKRDVDSPLVIAIELGDADVLDALLPVADVTLQDQEGRSALHHAASVGGGEAMRLLLGKLRHQMLKQHDSSTDEQLRRQSLQGDLRGRAALHVAAECGHRQALLELLKVAPEGIELKDSVGRAIIHIAASRGHLDLVTALVREHGVDVNAADTQGLTPLHHAAMSGHLSQVRALREVLGAEVGARDAEGWAPHHFATQAGHVDILEALLAEGDPLHESEAIELATLAAAAGQPQTLDLVLSHRSPARGDVAAWVGILCSALENAQYRTAVQILHLVPDDLVIHSDARRKVIDSLRACYRRDIGQAKELKVLLFLLDDAGYPVGDLAWRERLRSGVGPQPTEALGVHEYRWTPVVAEDVTYLAGRLGTVDEQYLVNEATTEVDVARLDWYEEHRLLRLRDKNWSIPSLALYYLIGPTQDLYRLNGTAPPIHEVNVEAPIRLTRENVLSYLVFFGFFVRGEEGPFYCLQSMDDPFVRTLHARSRHDPEVAAAIAAIGGTLRPLSFEGMNDRGDYLADGIIFYSNAMFLGNLLVETGGMVQMLNDEPIAGDLPFRIHAPIA